MGAETLWADGLVLPAPTLLAGQNSVDATAPVATLSSGSWGAVLAAPAPTLVSDYGTVAVLVAPALILSSTIDGGVRATAPVPVLVASIDEGVQVTLPAPTLVSSWDYQTRLIAPVPVLVASTSDAALIAPAPALEIVHSQGFLPMDALAPTPILVASAVAGEVLTVIESAPAPSLAAVLSNPAFITAVNIAPAAQLSSSGVSGNTLSAVLGAAAPIMDAAGSPAYTIVVALSAPAPYLNATLAATAAAAFRAWVLNTRKGALTEYGPEFAFNSFTQFNNQVLACGANGVVVLGLQDLDDVTAIDGRLRTGQESFESSFHKRVPRIYISGTFPGEMRFRTITVEGGTREYALPPNGITGLQQRRVPVGKGPKSRYWQFEVENVDGADFGVNDLLVYPIVLRRRVQ